jgi:cephalosporin hydroxylase
MTSEMISREEFQSRRDAAAVEMAKDEDLLKRALDVKVQAGHDYMWVHQQNWMGEPCLQLPTDMMATAEIVFRMRPKYIIECGVAWGGTTLFLASLLAITGGTSVIGLDIYVPDDLRTRIESEKEVSAHIQLIEASTVEPETVEMVKGILNGSDSVMVLLDSHHTHDHVLSELKGFAPLVGKDHYLICGDTAIERQPPAPLRPRPWGKGNNPATALVEYLALPEAVDLQVDLGIENKLLMSNNWGGYLQRRS